MSQHYKINLEFIDNDDSNLRSLYETSIRFLLKNFNQFTSLYYNDNARFKIENYFLRYSYPLIFFKFKKNDLTQIISLSLISCLFWRYFDNIIDNHGKTSENLIAYNILYDILNSSTNFDEKIQEHITLMLDEDKKTKNGNANYNEIWKRCSIFILPFQFFENEKPIELDLYIKYINYTGLSHDLHDILNDYSTKNKTLPVSWLLECDKNVVYSINTLNKVYTKARNEIALTENYFKNNEKLIESNKPIKKYIEESWQTFHN